MRIHCAKLHCYIAAGSVLVPLLLRFDQNYLFSMPVHSADEDPSSARNRNAVALKHAGPRNATFLPDTTSTVSGCTPNSSTPVFMLQQAPPHSGADSAPRTSRRWPSVSNALSQRLWFLALRTDSPWLISPPLELRRFPRVSAGIREVEPYPVFLGKTKAIHRQKGACLLAPQPLGPGHLRKQQSAAYPHSCIAAAARQ